MLKNITKEQSIKCSNCYYRDKQLDKIVFCPYVNNCKRTLKAEFPNTIMVEKGVKANEGDNT